VFSFIVQEYIAATPTLHGKSENLKTKKEVLSEGDIHDIEDSGKKYRPDNTAADDG